MYEQSKRASIRENRSLMSTSSLDSNPSRELIETRKVGLQPVPGSVTYSSLTCSKKVKQVDFIQTVHHKKGIKRNCASEHTTR